MGRKKLNNKYRTLQVKLLEEDFESFQRFCESSNTTMSDVVRDRIKSYIKKGHQLKEGDRNESI